MLIIVLLDIYMSYACSFLFPSSFLVLSYFLVSYSTIIFINVFSKLLLLLVNIND